MIDWSNIQADYERLGSRAKVAAEYGCSESAVQNAMLRRGIAAKPLKGRIYTWTPERIAEWSNLQADYDRLGSKRAVAEEYGCTIKVVEEALDKLGVKLRPMKGRKVEWSRERREAFVVAQNTPEAKAAHRAALLRRYDEGRVTGSSQGSPLEKLLHGALERAGLSFTTQRRKLDRYVVDIELIQASVIIEADGLRHQLERQKAKDAIRDTALTEAGYQVFRFTGTEINAGPDACIRKVIEAAGIGPEAEPAAVIRIGAHGEDNPNWRPASRSEFTCTHCGVKFTKYRQARSYSKTFCNQKCYGAWMSQHPEQSPVHVRWAS